MSLVFNMVGGSAGGLKDGSAILSVTVYAGSTVTATKGGVTLQPSLWLSGATSSTEVALFAFLPSQFDSSNPWTITAAGTSGTRQKTVLIATNTVYELSLVDELYIIQNGDIITTPTLVTATIGAKSGNYWYFGTTTTSFHAAYIRTDVTKFAVLTATIYPIAASAKTLGMWAQTAPTADNAMSAYTDMQSATTYMESTWTFDVSALTGEQTVGVRFGGHGSSFGIKELALE